MMLPTLLWAVALGALAIATSATTGHGAWLAPGTALGLAVIALGALGALAAHTAPAGQRWRALGRAAAWWAGAAVLGLVAHAGLERLTLMQTSYPALGRLAGALLSPLGEFDSTPAGEVAGMARDGALVFSIGVPKLGPALLVFALLCGYSAAARRLPATRMAAGGAVLGVVVVLRLAFEILRYADRERLLLPTFPSELLAFTAPASQIAWMAVAAVLLGALGFWRITPPPPAPVRSRRRVATALACAAAAGALIAAGLHLRLPTRPLSGKVVIDDRHSEYWGMAGRRMARDWYGDFSTYNLAAAAEYLGYHVPVTVHRGAPYDREMLADASVLVLKTPTLDFAPGEVEAILEFVHRGGGLVLVGDHTNLMGMSSRLNQLSMPAGIAFVFDAVSDARYGTFSRSRPGLVRHPAEPAGVSEFLTGCSLRLAAGTEALLVAPLEERVRGDYGAGSFFGRLHDDPRTDVGPVAHAAAGRYGAGTVLAFSDSTALSSFGLFCYGRDEFLLGAVCYAGRAPLRAPALRGAVLLGGALGGIASLALLAGGGWSVALAWLLLALGFLGGAAATQAVHDRVWALPQPVVALPSVHYVTRGTSAVIPAVLGHTDEALLDRSYDTFLAAFSRTGRMPRLIADVGDWPGSGALIVMNPDLPLTDAGRERLMARVRAGGTLLVGVRRDRLDAVAVRSYLRDSTIGLDYADPEHTVVRFVAGARCWQRVLGDSRVHCYGARLGAGKIVLVVGTEVFTRKRLGHAFDIPDATQRASYRAIFTLLDELSGVPVGDRRTYTLSP